jgi:2,4-dienoyl-CoA reductase-like NADH-dependent reductase (Old Yellow Enzyme family)
MRLEFTLSELARRFEHGEFDFVAVGRSLIGDPDWVKKVQARDFAAIRPFRKADVASLQWEF